MIRRLAFSGVLAAALAFAAVPALAHGGGGGGGGGIGHGNDVGAASGNAGANRQGPSHAATEAGLNANAHAGLAGASKGVQIPGLTKGMTLTDSTGAAVGTITKVNRSAGGVVRAVLVTPAASTGLHRHTVPIRPDTITLTGGVATTTTLASSLKGK